MTPPPKPTWLARTTGLAHAFLPRTGSGLQVRAVCRHVYRSIERPFTAPPDGRARCGTCVLRLRAAAKAAERAAKEGL